VAVGVECIAIDAGPGGTELVPGITGPRNVL